MFDGSNRSLFDVSMGAYNGGEMCKLVGSTYNLLSKKYNKNDSGLYLHDGLAVLKIQNRPQSEQVKRKIQKISNMKSVNVCI